MDKDKALELARKLNELAKRGEGGEKINAESMLKKIMEKHGFTIDDIEKKPKSFIRLRYDNSFRNQFRQEVNQAIDWETDISWDDDDTVKLLASSATRFSIWDDGDTSGWNI